MVAPESNEQILDKLDLVIEAIYNSRPQQQFEIKHLLWNCSEIAKYVGVTYKYANEYIVTHHHFPNAIRLPTKNGKRGHPRWYANEVIQWVAQHRE